MALDYLLCYDLLIKDIETFRADIMKHLPGDNPLTPGKSTALLISIVSGRDSRENYHNYVFDPAILRGLQIIPVNMKKPGRRRKLIDRYADTYWFYYHFAEMKQTE